jgi:hypothetical protein
MMRLYYVLDDDGQPKPVSDVVEWGRWFEAAKRQVADTMVGCVRISTVFLGLDHSFSDDGPLIVFETMIFGGSLNGEQDRYASREQAIEGHAAAVQRVRRTLS